MKRRLLFYVLVLVELHQIVIICTSYSFGILLYTTGVKAIFLKYIYIEIVS